jgi:hypothetical protein
MSCFPTAAFADPITSDQKLKDAFDSAINAVKNDPIYKDSLPLIDELPIIIVALNLDKTRPAAGQHISEMFYSGSLLKIAAMYAAFQLREAVNALAATMDFATVTDESIFFTAVQKEFDQEILGAPDLIKHTSTTGNRAPIYKTIFTATQDLGDNTWSVDFRSDVDPKFDFAGHLSKMIVDSHNPSAGFCIQMLGFSFINGLLLRGGFFDPRAKRGIWLAGDYLNPLSFINAEYAKEGAHPGSGDPDSVEEHSLGISGWLPITIPSVNDGEVKQVTTCTDAAKLMVLLADDKLVGTTGGASVGIANSEMLAMLHRGVSGGAPSLVGRVPTVFTVLQSKIGVGDLKPVNGGQKVFSEALIVKQAGPPMREFVVVWQNVKAATHRDFDRIRDIIQNTADAYS